MNIKSTASEISEQMGKCYWKFEERGSLLKESLAKCCLIIWKAELINEENKHSSEKISSKMLKTLPGLFLLLKVE